MGSAGGLSGAQAGKRCRAGALGCSQLCPRVSAEGRCGCAWRLWQVACLAVVVACPLAFVTCRMAVATCHMAVVACRAAVAACRKGGKAVAAFREAVGRFLLANVPSLPPCLPLTLIVSTERRVEE
jgi:hypothetical protein